MNQDTTALSTTASNTAAGANTPLYRFEFTSGYMGVTEYKVHGDGSPYRVNVRHSLHECERKIYNGDNSKWLANEVPTLNSAYRDNNPCYCIPDAVIRGLDAWRTAKHNELMAKLDGDTYRYGVIKADDSIRRSHPPLRGIQLRGDKPGIGCWRVTTGWPGTPENAAWSLQNGRHDFGGRGTWTFELADGSANGWDLLTKEDALAAAHTAVMRQTQ